MKVLYYTLPCYLDCAMHWIQALNETTELHACLELGPNSWKNSLFDLPMQVLPSGIVPADPIFKENFPAGIEQFWSGLSSFHLVMHNQRKSLHPSSWRRSWELTRFVRMIEPDIVHLDDVSLRLAPFLWRFRRFPIVINLHDPVPHSGESNWRTEVSYKLALRKSAHIFVHSEFCKKLAIETLSLAAEHVSVVHLGVYDVYREWIREQTESEEKVVLFFGRISPYKGIDVLLEAARYCDNRLHKCKFIIAGRVNPGYQIPALPMLSNGNSIEILEKYFDNAELAHLMQRASVVVCPYVDATQSGVVLTAYAFNKPVIVTDVGGLTEYVWEGETGLIVPAKNPKALADALVRFFNDYPLRTRMSSALLNIRTDRLNWRTSAKQMISRYEQLVGIT